MKNELEHLKIMSLSDLGDVMSRLLSDADKKFIPTREVENTGENTSPLAILEQILEMGYSNSQA